MQFNLDYPALTQPNLTNTIQRSQLNVIQANLTQYDLI